MKVSLLAQPYNGQLGLLLTEALERKPAPTLVTFISAFVGMQTVRRLEGVLPKLAASGTQVQLVIGVDMGGTSKEVLSRLSSWPVQLFVFRNRSPRVTFHPKIYLVESANRADLFVGSNNLTEGGFFTNYEGAVHLHYSLPADFALLASAKEELSRFLSPKDPIGRPLDGNFLNSLLQRDDIPSEEEARKARQSVRKEHLSGTADHLFAYEATASAPPLPKSVVDAVVADAQEQVKQKRKKPKQDEVDTPAGHQTEDLGPLATAPNAQLIPDSFFLELVTTSGKNNNIPGEQRIPLEAIAAARAFWGFPQRYLQKVNPRKGGNAAGEARVYLEWHPVWRVMDLSDPAHDDTRRVRMYYYANSSDFRFYAGKLSSWKAGAGDIVRIRRIENADINYECQLARKGTDEHADWLARCTQTSPRTKRRFGFS